MEEITEAKPERALGALVAAFLLAAVHQYLFYGHMPGVSVPIFVGLLYVFMLYYAKEALRELTWFSYVWLGAVVLLSMTYALYANPFFAGLNLLVLPGMILLHMTYLLSYRRPAWIGFPLIGAAAEHLFPQMLRSLGAILPSLRGTGDNSVSDERKQVLLKVLIGLAISCPLLIIVLSLLSSADGVFNETLAKLPELLERISFGEGFARFMWLILLGSALFGLVRGFAAPKHYEWTVPPKEGEPVLEPVNFSIDPIVMTTILAAVNTVYVLFVSVLFSYLFGAWEGIVPEGSTYADYARSGFFELILVTGINFAILLLSLFAIGKGKPALRKAIRMLLYILVLCSLVMLYSAYSRLDLYEEAYGYTYIRFLVHAFMIFLGLLMVLAAIRIGKANFPLGKSYIVLSLLSYVLMNYIGMDNIIAAQNIKRYEDSGSLDAGYLAGLSWEAVPQLVRFSKEEDGFLKQQLLSKWQNAAKAEAEWPAFNVAEYRGRRALEQYFNP